MMDGKLSEFYRGFHINFRESLMKNSSRSMHKKQRGIVWFVVVIVIVVVIAVVGAIATATSTPSSPEAGPVPPGCYPTGTQCRIFIQNEVSCCGGQPVVGQRIGWCLGWYDAQPCK
jgi:heme/copper-type cytochrome/quinol oxidase subunit 2